MLISRGRHSAGEKLTLCRCRMFILNVNFQDERLKGGLWMLVDALHQSKRCIKSSNRPESFIRIGTASGQITAPTADPTLIKASRALNNATHRISCPSVTVHTTH